MLLNHEFPERTLPKGSKFLIYWYKNVFCLEMHLNTCSLAQRKDNLLNAPPHLFICPKYTEGSVCKVSSDIQYSASATTTNEGKKPHLQYLPYSAPVNLAKENRV